jgi:hypothetical protein
MRGDRLASTGRDMSVGPLVLSVAVSLLAGERNDRTPRYICLYRMSDSFAEAVQIRSAVLHLHSAVQELKDTITAFNVAANKQSKIMIRLTWVIAILTFLLLVGLGVQIWLAIASPLNGPTGPHLLTRTSRHFSMLSAHGRARDRSSRACRVQA